MTAPRLIAVLLGIACTTVSCRDAAAPQFDTASYDLIFESTVTPADNQPTVFLLPQGVATRNPLLGATVYAAQPRVSLNGQWVAYIAPRPEDAEAAVWLARTDGTGARQVFTTSGELLSRPAPSPDGSRVAFQATDAVTGDSKIWIVNAGGSGARALTTAAHAGPFVHAAPAWSPDGTQLALAAGVAGNLGIATMSAEGGPLTMRTQPTVGSDTDPFWSPDGARLVFSYTTTMALSDIVVLTLAGGARRTIYAGNARHPAWSPGGALIAFSGRIAGGAPELFAVPAVGGTAVRLTTNELSDRYPNWIRRPSLD